MKMVLQIIAGCIGTLAWAGCFGDNDGSGPEAPSIVSIEAPEGVDAEGGQAEISVRVHGRAGEQLTVAIAGSLGAFVPEQAMVTADAMGDATFVTQFTAGAVTGDVATTVNVTGVDGERESRDFSFPVRALVRVGEVTQLPNTIGFIPNFLDGHTIVTTAAGRLRKIGLHSPGGGEVAIGIYADSAGSPTTLVASASATLRAGVNELPVSEVALPAGTYWYMMNFRNTTNVYRGSANRTVRGLALSFSTSLPATFPAGSSAVAEPVRNGYLVLGQ